MYWFCLNFLFVFFPCWLVGFLIFIWRKTEKNITMALWQIIYSLSSCSPIQRHCIQPCHVQKVTVHAGVLLFDATVLWSPRSPDVVLGECVLRMLISCPVCHRIHLTLSMFVFGTTENTPNIIRTHVVFCYLIFLHFKVRKQKVIPFK